MRRYGCTTCRIVYQVGSVSLEELDSAWRMLDVSDNPQCPTPLCQGKLKRIEDRVDSAKLKSLGYRLEEIPFQAFYRAIYGFGGPKGEAATVERFTHLVKTKKIVDVSAHATGQPERVILKRLILEDGTILHFDTSARGACCYYIEEPGPSCMEVVEDELRREGATKSSGEDREEGGRAAEDGDVDSSAAGGDTDTAETPTAECASTGCLPPVPESSDLLEHTGSDRIRRGLGPSKSVRMRTRFR